ncbi:MAG: hypothetical protein AAB676_14010 [Verrucomicrobiota bacterium]
MSRSRKHSIADQLDAARILIDNSLLDPEIQAAVAEQGYDEAELKQGQELLKAAENTCKEKTQKAGGQKAATAEVEQTFKAGQKACQALAKVARKRFTQNPALLEKLGLTGSMPRTTAEFIIAGRTLFDNALKDPEILAGLAKRKYTETKLKTEREKIEAFAKADQTQEAAKGTAQAGTSDQAGNLEALNNWVAEYRENAKLALADKPQLLPKIGLALRASKTDAQRAAPKKAAETRKKNKEGGQ